MEHHTPGWPVHAYLGFCSCSASPAEAFNIQPDHVIDAICIDQHDEADPSVQMELMGGFSTRLYRYSMDWPRDP